MAVSTRSRAGHEGRLHKRTVSRGIHSMRHAGWSSVNHARRVVARASLAGCGFLGFVGIWWLIARHVGPLLVPSPVAVWRRFTLALVQGVYVPAFTTTLIEAASGWVIGIVFGISCGYVLARSKRLESVFGVYMGASQAVPIIGIAPLLLIWVGYGMEPKIVLAALIAFFPIAISSLAGVRGVDRDLIDVGRSVGAAWWQILVFVEAPLAARAVFAGAKVAAALAVTGAMVGEFVVGNQGLGYMVLFGVNNFDYAYAFVGLISLMGLGAMTFGTVSGVEKIVLRYLE